MVSPLNSMAFICQSSTPFPISSKSSFVPQRTTHFIHTTPYPAARPHAARLTPTLPPRMCGPTSSTTTTDTNSTKSIYSNDFALGVLALEHEGAYAVMDAARAQEERTGRKVIHMEIGQPGFDTPSNITDAGVNALRSGRTRYSSPAGDPCLRGLLAKWLRDERGMIHVQAENVVIGPGAKPGLFFTTMALVRGPHDEVIIPDPGFPTYAAMVSVAGGTAVPVKLSVDAETGAMNSYDMAELRKHINDNTRMVVLNSPGNPTGGTMSRADIEAIADLAEKHDFWILSDEIYSMLTYDAQAHRYFSPLNLARVRARTVVVDGFSKAFCMTGWRLGWAVLPRQLAQKVELLLVHAVGCTATFVQDAGLEAISGLLKNERGTGKQVLREMQTAFRKRRDIVVDGINRIDGLSCARPSGAFYAWVDITKTGRTSKQVADHLLEDGCVAVLPGTDFGRNGEGFIRLSYVAEEDVLEEGIRRIEGSIKELMAGDAASTTTSASPSSTSA